jgi:hypothetical protein
MLIVTSSLLLIGSSFQWQKVSFLWVPELSLTSATEHRAIALLKILSQLGKKNPMTSSGFKPAIFWLVA